MAAVRVEVVKAAAVRVGVGGVQARVEVATAQVRLGCGAVAGKGQERPVSAIAGTPAASAVAWGCERSQLQGKQHAPPPSARQARDSLCRQRPIPSCPTVRAQVQCAVRAVRSVGASQRHTTLLASWSSSHGTRAPPSEPTRIKRREQGRERTRGTRGRERGNERESASENAGGGRSWSSCSGSAARGRD